MWSIYSGAMWSDYPAYAIYEAYMACTEHGSQLGKLLDSGNLRVADLKTKQDVIVMHFATPECQEAFIFPVDIKNRTIGERFDTSNAATNGLFANLCKRELTMYKKWQIRMYEK